MGTPVSVRTPADILASEFELVWRPLKETFQFEEARMHHATKDIGDVQSVKESKFNWYSLREDAEITILGAMLMAPKDRRQTTRTSAHFSLTTRVNVDRTLFVNVSSYVNTMYLFHGLPPRSLQSAVVKQAGFAFLGLGQLSTYIAFDSYDSPSSPAEVKRKKITRDYRKYLRGCYWGNFLGREHCERMGGDTVVKNAPAEVIEPIGEGYYVQVTRDVAECTDEKIDALSQYLAPIAFQADD